MRTFVLVALSAAWTAALGWASLQDIRSRKIRNSTLFLVFFLSAAGTMLQIRHQFSIMMPGLSGSQGPIGSAFGSMILAVLVSHLLSALLLSVPMLAADVRKPGSFGGADIKLGFAGAFMLPFKDGLEAFYVSFLLAAVLVIWWKYRKRQEREQKSEMNSSALPVSSAAFPLAPCLSVGMLYGLIRTLTHILT